MRTAADADKEEIAKLQAHIDESYDLSEKYVDEMTNRYLKIDFDRAEEFDRIISAYILNGELDKADSMLARKGDIVERIQRNKNMQEVVVRDKEDLAKDCFRKAEIAMQRLERDSVAYYLELRASLDPHNMDWQIEAGRFIQHILADYNRVLAIYELALEYVRLHYGELHDKTSTLYNNIGLVYHAQGNYTKALEYYNNSLDIQIKVLGLEHSEIATVYNNIGMVYYEQGDYVKALEYYNKALDIDIKVYGLEHPNIATLYSNIGLIYIAQENYAKAYEYQNKALNLFEKILGKEHEQTKAVLEIITNLEKVIQR